MMVLTIHRPAFFYTYFPLSPQEMKNEKEKANASCHLII
jgi:hypothetical protein